MKKLFGISLITLSSIFASPSEDIDFVQIKKIEELEEKLRRSENKLQQIETFLDLKINEAFEELYYAKKKGKCFKEEDIRFCVYKEILEFLYYIELVNDSLYSNSLRENIFSYLHKTSYTSTSSLSTSGIIST